MSDDSNKEERSSKTKTLKKLIGNLTGKDSSSKSDRSSGSTPTLVVHDVSNPSPTNSGTISSSGKLRFKRFLILKTHEF